MSLLARNDGGGGGPEKNLDETYTTALRSCLQADYDDEKRKEVSGALRKVLGSSAALSSPLSIHSLSSLLSMPSNEIDETLAACHSIVDIPGQPDDTTCPHDPTFRDLLFDKNRRSDAQFWVDEKAAHDAMAVNCVRLLSKMLKKDICDLKSPGAVVADVDPSVRKQAISPAVEYASRYWVQHYRDGDAQLHDGCETHKFLENHLLHWIEVMSIMGHASEVPEIIRTYEALLPVSGEDN